MLIDWTAKTPYAAAKLMAAGVSVAAAVTGGTEPCSVADERGMIHPCIHIFVT